MATDSAWLGGHLDSGAWVWQHNSESITLQFWGVGQPDPFVASVDNCIGIAYYMGGYYSSDCATERVFICEFQKTAKACTA